MLFFPAKGVNAVKAKAVLDFVELRPGEFQRLEILVRGKAAGVEYFDGIHQRGNFE